MKIVEYDPELSTVEAGPRMVQKKSDVRSLRYSPDQPRDDHGRFGQGNEEKITNWDSLPTEGVHVQGGAVTLTAYRTGGLKDSFGRGIFFGSTAAEIQPYADIHEGATVEKYTVEAENAIVAPNVMVLYAQQNPGKTFQDAVWKADKASGFKSSVNAARKVEASVARTAKAAGHDAIIYTRPPAPAKAEITVIDRSTAKIK
jgi:hypothetical protein